MSHLGSSRIPLVDPAPPNTRGVSLPTSFPRTRISRPKVDSETQSVGDCHWVCQTCGIVYCSIEAAKLIIGEDSPSRPF